MLQATRLPDDDLASTWKALANPVRREILDRLRQRPMTTGELAGLFDLSRFAVMQHLGVLVEAGLVFVRRQGRERWNHLNPMPIHQIARRWIRPFEVDSAERLLRLKQVAERLEEDSQMPEPGDRAFRTVDVQHELRIKATPERVWQALTAEIAAWWPAKFYVGAAPIRFTLEPRVGGRVYEDWGDGEGALWSTVTSVRVGEHLQWVGDIPAEFGGPARSITSFTLEPGKSGTLLKFRDTMFGEISAEMQQNMASGWKFLLADCFQPFVEERKQPERPASVIAHEGHK